ncbi:MAG: hypothetical protein DCC68_08820 [Planctomycetota bacterium]|nr:MAG: hypothetical protein DCC68_08820 [Planctomycetota bacterium]
MHRFAIEDPTACTRGGEHAASLPIVAGERGSPLCTVATLSLYRRRVVRARGRCIGRGGETSRRGRLPLDS